MSPVKIAFLGCGGFMGVHANRIKQIPDARLVALCDVTAEQVERFIQKNLADLPERPAVFTSAREMYQTARPDAVFIATPHTLHFEHGMEALDHGCHVYMEKPMVTRLDHAYQLAERVRQAGKVFVVGYNSPCSAEFAYLRNLIRQKELGRLELVTGFLVQGWMKGTVGKWRQDPALSGGGQAYDSGAHLLNSLCWSVEQDVEEVFAYVDNHGTPVDINSLFVIKFAGGTRAAITVGGNCPADVGVLHFIFENGRVEIDAWQGSWINVFKGRERVKYPPITPDMGHASPTHNFVEAILGKTEARTGPRNGIIQSQLMDAIYESARTGAPARPQRR